MRRLAFFAVILSWCTPSFAAPDTDWGVRTVGGATSESSVTRLNSVTIRSSRGSGPVDMAGIIRIGRQWGRVTSTLRSPAHNRRVGGVRNSYHLVNRAIDIARRPGVTHWQIDNAFRSAGYFLVESLDEGDHSHFAFSATPIIRSNVGGSSTWKIVTAPAPRE